MAGDQWIPGMNLPFDPIASKLADELGVTVKILNGRIFRIWKKRLTVSRCRDDHYVTPVPLFATIGHDHPVTGVIRLQKLQKTKFTFPDTVTVVIGPNGSGKTNLLEALQVAATEKASARKLTGRWSGGQ